MRRLPGLATNHVSRFVAIGTIENGGAMFELARGNLLEADVEAVVNTVNTEGVMGKGVALQFRKAYPDNYEAYRRGTGAGGGQPRRRVIFDSQKLTHPPYTHTI